MTSRSMSTMRRNLRHSGATLRTYANRGKSRSLSKTSYPITLSIDFEERRRQEKRRVTSKSLPLNTNLSLRQISTMTEILPEFAKNISIWGGSGHVIKTFHSYGIPYWGCMSLTNVVVRTSLVPLVIQGAKTSAAIGKVAPEVQFLMTNYTRDAQTLKAKNASPSQRLELLIAMWQSLKGVYKLHNVNPFAILKSPLMQIPVFWYFSVDIRKLVNGGDPALAQELTENGFLWVTDLTEPDPWYGLPVLAGMFLYLNVEVAVGKQSLSGETASKSNLARYLKDGFQSLAVLMPCLVSQSPAGVQVYLLTSFIFTLFQGAALRHDPFREAVGLQSRNAQLADGKFVKEFIDLNRLERQSHGILDQKFHSSFRPFAQVMTAGELKELQEENDKLKKDDTPSKGQGGGVFAPDFYPSYVPSPIYLIPKNFEPTKESDKNNSDQKDSFDKIDIIAPTDEEIMEAANRGELPAQSVKVFSSESTDDTGKKTLSLKGHTFKKKRNLFKKGAKKSKTKRR